ncbi:hypothetical protein [Streptomyces rimosus]|uniref:hypothetical protein n=1 Tax=Streptomyces rimosus TaxID=1927 RepID=UPI00131D4226|nr:hypothetical protein [Streptomyces rimosus]
MTRCGVWWWARARRLWVLGMALAAFAALVAATQQGVAVPLLSLLSAVSVPVQLLLFAPVPVVAALGWCLDNRLPEAEAIAVRSVRLTDTALAAATGVVAVAVAAVLAAAADSAAAVAAGRDTCFLVGLMLCLRPVLGQGAVMTGPAWLAVVVFFGFAPDSALYRWTIVGHPATSVPSLAVTTLTLAAGLAVLARSTRRSL